MKWRREKTARNDIDFFNDGRSEKIAQTISSCFQSGFTSIARAFADPYKLNQFFHVRKNVVVAAKRIPMVNHARPLIAFKAVQQFFFAVTPRELRERARPELGQHSFRARNFAAFEAVRQTLLFGALSVFAPATVATGGRIASAACRILGTKAACQAAPRNSQISPQSSPPPILF